MEPLYARCRDALHQARARASFAETHGVLCGLLCVPGGASTGGWLEELLGDPDADPGAIEECRGLLATCLAHSARELAADGFEFAPLLPADDETLDMRSFALGEWCAGFVYGFGIGAKTDLQALSPEAREAIADLTQLARLAADAAGADGDERDYAELVEYVRVAVMSVYESSAGGDARREG